MIDVPRDFIESLINVKNPLDMIWRYIIDKIWVPKNSISMYYNKNEKAVGDFERFVRDIYFEVYDELLMESSKRRPRLKEILSQDRYVVAVCDGMSLREANLLIDDLRRNGFYIEEYTYEISHLPSDTLVFTSDIFGISAPSALRTSSDWRDRSIYLEDITTDYPLPHVDKLLLFSRYPDKGFDTVSPRVGDSLERVYQDTSRSLLTYMKKIKPEKIVITSDHGYCTKHPGANWSVPRVEKEIYQETFGLSRFKKLSEIFGDMEAKIMEVAEKTDRIKILQEYAIINGRYVWPVRGDQRQIYHGGISFMENFVPFIVARWEGGR
jgi:hypothetical protein